MGTTWVTSDHPDYLYKTTVTKNVLEQHHAKFAKRMFHNNDLIQNDKLQKNLQRQIAKKHLERQLENLANKTSTTTIRKKIIQYKQLLVFHYENF